MQTSNGWFVAKLVRVSLGKAQTLVMLRCFQSCRSIPWEQAAEERPWRPLQLPWHFTATCLGTTISVEKLPEAAGFFSHGFGFSFLLFFALNFPPL